MSYTLECSNCGVSFCMPDHMAYSRKRDHDTFYCPNGHSQHFPGKTEEERKIASLEKSREVAWERVNEEAQRATTLADAHRSCPLCLARSPRRPRWGDTEDWIASHRTWLREHLKEDHKAQPVRKQIAEKVGA